MKILFLTQLLPYPLDNGGKVKTLAILKTLKGLGHQIYLVCFADKKQDLKRAREIENICWQTKVFYNPVITKSYKKLMLKGFLSLFSPKPFAVFKYHRREAEDFLKRVIQKENFDIVYIDHLHMAQYLACLSFKKKPLLIYDEHNITSLAAWRNFKVAGDLVEKIAYFIDSSKWNFYEKKYLPIFHRIFTISPRDRSFLLNEFNISKDKIFFLPVPIKIKPLFKFNPRRVNILFVGLLSWKPNRDAFWWFYRSIFPLVKKEISQAKLFVAGANPSLNMLKTAQKDGALQVLGYVKDLEALMGKASVFVVPIKSGSGIRIKILTALSHGLPVVTTKLGVEGIGLRSRKELIVANNAKDFARAVVEVVKNKRLANNLSQSGIRLISKDYNLENARKILSLNL